MGKKVVSLTYLDPMKRLGLEELVCVCEAYLEKRIKRGHFDDEDEVLRIFEAAMKVVYGNNIFEYMEQISE